MLKQYIERFVSEEDGAVTVDWVVLCAAVVGLAIAVASTMQTQLTKEANLLGSRMTHEINSMPATPTGAP